MKSRTGALALAGALSLTGCSRYDPDKCLGLVIDNDATARGAYNCIVEWSLKMASGPDAANVIADGVTWVCRAAIKAVVAKGADEGRSAEAVMAEQRRQAIFYVSQERAGHCLEK